MAAPAQANRLEVLNNLRLSIIDVAFAVAFISLVSGNFLVGFIQDSGGSDFWIGLTAAIPNLVGLAQIPGAVWGRSFPSFQPFIAWGGLVWRIFHLPLIVLPLLPIPGVAKLTIMSICLGLASLAIKIVDPIYNDWLAEMVPPGSRGWFFSRRSATFAAVGAGIGFLGGLLLDAFRNNGQDDIGFATIFGLAIACSAVSFFFFLRMKDMPRPHPQPARVRDALSGFWRPFADPRFRPVLFFLGVFVTGQMLAGNLFSAFALESLEMSFGVLQLTGVTHAVGMVASVGVWGYLSDKYGNKPLLAILAAMLFLSPVMWIFCFPGNDPWNAVILITGHLFAGTVWGGITVCQLNLVLATAPEEDRPTYIASALMLNAVMAAIAPLMGATLMSTMREILSPDWAYKTVFMAAMVLRVSALVPLFRVHEPGSTTIAGTLEQLRSVTPEGYRALRRLGRARSVGEREQAMESLASTRFGVAGDELIGLLNDPSPRIRRQAARSLAKVGGPKAAQALINHLRQNPLHVGEETLEALEELGDPAAVDVLIEYLQSPSSQLRRAAAKALGRMNDSKALGPLSAAATDASDPDLRRAALQALRTLGDPACEAVIGQAIYDEHPSVRIAAAEAVSDLELVGLRDRICANLENLSDEAANELAYALGTIGELTDIPRILVAAQHSPTAIGRRRALLGAARLMGVEAEAYSLMKLEGMARDSALVEIAKAVRRSVPQVERALELYSTGNEPEALSLLAAGTRDAGIASIAGEPVPEGFLIAMGALKRGAR